MRTPASRSESRIHLVRTPGIIVVIQPRPEVGKRQKVRRLLLRRQANGTTVEENSGNECCSSCGLPDGGSGRDARSSCGNQPQCFPCASRKSCSGRKAMKE